MLQLNPLKAASLMKINNVFKAFLIFVWLFKKKCHLMNGSTK